MSSSIPSDVWAHYYGWIRKGRPSGQCPGTPVYSRSGKVRAAGPVLIKVGEVLLKSGTGP